MVPGMQVERFRPQAGCPRDWQDQQGRAESWPRLKDDPLRNYHEPGFSRVRVGPEVKEAGKPGPWALLLPFLHQPSSLVSREEKMTSVGWQKERGGVQRQRRPALSVA